MADLRTTRRKQGKIPGGRTGTPVQQGHAMRRVQLACGHLQRDRIAHPGDHVWWRSRLLRLGPRQLRRGVTPAGTTDLPARADRRTGEALW
jgi:hypothetical protein